MLASDTMRYLNSPMQLFEVVLGYNLVVYFGMYAEHAFFLIINALTLWEVLRLLINNNEFAIEDSDEHILLFNNAFINGVSNNYED